MVRGAFARDPLNIRSSLFDGALSQPSRKPATSILKILEQVGMTDVTPWAVDLSFADLDESKGFKGVLGGLFGGGKKDGKDAAPTLKTAGEVFKEVPLYGENTPLPLKKTLSITRSENFEVGEREKTRENTRSKRARG